jgi:phage baseplate assembly protein W|tara:strand:- start:283 stop:735 length:453 start_codon:yes stop_codon:yes gene_type:complete
MAIPARKIFRINQADEDERIAVGIDLPLVKASGAPFPQTRLTIDAAKANLKNLILTRKGERPFHPELGTSIYDFLFDPNMDEMLVNIEEEINNAIAKFLPYLIVTDLIVAVADQSYGFSDNFNGVRISISFTLAGNRFDEQSVVLVIGAE